MFGIQNMAGLAGSSYLDLLADGIGLVIACVRLKQLQVNENTGISRDTWRLES
jgi:hypothetical protein